MIWQQKAENSCWGLGCKKLLLGSFSFPLFLSSIKNYCSRIKVIIIRCETGTNESVDAIMKTVMHALESMRKMVPSSHDSNSTGIRVYALPVQIIIFIYIYNTIRFIFIYYIHSCHHDHGDLPASIYTFNQSKNCKS